MLNCTFQPNCGLDTMYSVNRIFFPFSLTALYLFFFFDFGVRKFLEFYQKETAYTFRGFGKIWKHVQKFHDNVILNVIAGKIFEYIDKWKHRGNGNKAYNNRNYFWHETNIISMFQNENVFLKEILINRLYFNDMSFSLFYCLLLDWNCVTG